jgi:hypothetical protein
MLCSVDIAEVVMAPSTEPTPRAAALRLLGLPDSATAPQIVDAYRRLVRATHPDATGRTDPTTAQHFAAIHDACKMLTQPDEDDAGRVEPSPYRPPGEGAVEARERAPRPRMAVRPHRVRPPIVAGPVVVDPLPEQHRPNPRRPR